MTEGFAFDVFGSDKMASALRLADVIDGDDIRVIQCRRRFGFRDESSQAVFIAVELFAWKLDGDFAVETVVFGEPHFAHAALAELLYDPVMRDCL